jgi:hypothetical protein
MGRIEIASFVRSNDSFVPVGELRRYRGDSDFVEEAVLDALAGRGVRGCS